MEPVMLLAAFVVFLALFFDFTNGFHDSANQVATVITSRALSPELALTIAAVANYIGAYFLGTAVAQTLGKGIVDPRLLEAGGNGVYVIIAALLGAIIWNLFTWWFGIPSSSSHALIGGLIGAFLVGWGADPINWPNVLKIIGIMICSPIVGFVICLLFTKLTIGFSQWATPKANRVFKWLQVVSSTAQAVAHGTNDAQKTMGVIMFSLVILGFYQTNAVDLAPPARAFIISTLAAPPAELAAQPETDAALAAKLNTVSAATVVLANAERKRIIALLENAQVQTQAGAPAAAEREKLLKALKALPIPGWVVFACSLAMALGTLMGGWRIIKKLGAGLYKVRPIHGFASQTVATGIIETAAVLGFPLSTTQVISSSVMGAGAAFRPKMIRWQVAQDMGLAWLITIPASGLIAALVFLAEKIIFL